MPRWVQAILCPVCPFWQSVYRYFNLFGGVCKVKNTCASTLCTVKVWFSLPETHSFALHTPGLQGICKTMIRICNHHFPAVLTWMQLQAHMQPAPLHLVAPILILMILMVLMSLTNDYWLLASSVIHSSATVTGRNKKEIRKEREMPTAAVLQRLVTIPAIRLLLWWPQFYFCFLSCKWWIWCSLWCWNCLETKSRNQSSSLFFCFFGLTIWIYSLEVWMYFRLWSLNGWIQSGLAFRQRQASQNFKNAKVSAGYSLSSLCPSW